MWSFYGSCQTHVMKEVHTDVRIQHWGVILLTTTENWTYFTDVRNIQCYCVNRYWELNPYRLMYVKPSIQQLTSKHRRKFSLKYLKLEHIHTATTCNATDGHGLISKKINDVKHVFMGSCTCNGTYCHRKISDSVAVSCCRYAGLYPVNHYWGLNQGGSIIWIGSDSFSFRNGFFYMAYAREFSLRLQYIKLCFWLAERLDAYEWKWWYFVFCRSYFLWNMGVNI